jgi:hypothetical protein
MSFDARNRKAVHFRNVLMSPDRRKLVSATVTCYLGCSDFKGYCLKNVPPKELRRLLRPLLEKEIIAGRYGDLDINPFIRPFSDPAPDVQLEMLESSDLDLVILYPTKKELTKHVNPLDYNGRPFTLELAKGYGQLDFRCFDLSVLEFYRNDPRYYYKASDVFGVIYAQDDAVKSMATSDRVFLKTFGFGYDKEMNRAVLVFLRYLHKLTPEHQQIWNSKLLSAQFDIHPDYYNGAIRGMWSDHIPILDAFLEEVRYVNEMSKLMGKPQLFRHAYGFEDKPKGFTFLIRPTKREFLDFVHLLDKMLSENLNKKFFEADIETTEEILRPGGRVEVKQISTIGLLERWLTVHWHPIDPAPLKEALKTLREIRTTRQSPAHSIEDDEFDQSYFKQQRDLIIRAYTAVRLLRLLFTEHPLVKGFYKGVSKQLFEGKIRTF